MHWASQGQWPLTIFEKSRCNVKGQMLYCSDLYHANISIPVNGGKLRGCKYNFLEKSVGGCTFYDVIDPWPNMTWSFFAKSCAKDAPSAMQNFSVIRSAVRKPFQKNSLGGGSHRPPMHGRGLMALNVHVICPVFSERILNVCFHVFLGRLIHACTFLLFFCKNWVA